MWDGNVLLHEWKYEVKDRPQLIIDEDGNVITNGEARKRSIDLPYQNINHYRAALNSNILLNGGQLKSALAFQRNIRKEFDSKHYIPKV